MAKKPGYFTVRLTVSVYHPPYGQLFVIFWGCSFDLISCLYVFWNEFYTRKVIFIQLQEIPTPPHCCCCSVTKWSDSVIEEALKALKMHLWDPSQWDKMCFEYHRVKYPFFFDESLYTSCAMDPWILQVPDQQEYTQICFKIKSIQRPNFKYLRWNHWTPKNWTLKQTCGGQFPIFYAMAGFFILYDEYPQQKKKTFFICTLSLGE